MKQTYLYTFRFSFAVLILSFILTLLSGEMTLLTFINTSFLISLPLLILGGFLFVFERGFFNAALQGFRRLSRSKAKAEGINYFEEDDNYPAHKKSYPITIPLLFSGLLMFLLTMAAGFLIS